MAKIGRAGLGVSFIALIAAGTAPAYAQDSANSTQTPCSPNSATPCNISPTAQPPLNVSNNPDVTGAPVEATNASNDIVVTGTRIRAPNDDSVVPITSINGEQFFKTGDVSIIDKLDQLPSLHSTFTAGNSTRFIGTEGLGLLDLYGLGTQRTLVLINGRRQVTSALLSTGTEVDVNTIPTDLIDRVDTLTGGDAAVYGSDAIAGVVNFVLKDHYQGFQIRGQGGISQYGDASSEYISALAGKNFASDRGNIAVNVEYAHEGPAYASDRPNLRNTAGFVTTDVDSASMPDDGIADTTFYNDIRSAQYSNGGTVENFNNPMGAGYEDYLFQSDGTLVPQTGTRIGVNQTSYEGGNGSTFREGDQIYLQPIQDRVDVNLLGHFDVSSAFKPFIEAKFARTHQYGNQSGPSFIFEGGILGDPYGREIFHTDNPYLSSQARSVIESIYPDGTLAAPDGVNDADEYGFYLNRNNQDLGSRNESTDRNLYRIVLGTRGDLSSHLNYEVSGEYSAFREKGYQEGNLDIQRFLFAIDAVRDPSSGNIVCRVQIDPSARIAYPGGEPYLATDVSTCVPLDLFGQNTASAAAKAYVNPITSETARADQLDITGYLSGDTGGFFNLPGGPVGFSIGGEYRRETQYQAYDQLVQSGITFENAIPTFDPPSLEVKEAFGELRIPLLKDLPFVHELTLSGSGRISDYKGAVGTVYAYNGGAVWSPFDGLRLRGNYSRAVRAPALTESYGVQSQNYAPGFVDPCALNQIATGSSTRAANCAAAGIPTDYNFVYGSSLEILSGGNPDLKAETSDSYTLGAVVSPHFTPGLVVSVDYFNITVNNVITAPDAQDIANACYDAASLDNQFCSLFQRNPAGTFQGTQDVSYSIENGTLLDLLLNYAKLKTSGIDGNVQYQHRFGSLDLGSTFDLTFVIANDQYIYPDDPGRRQQLLYELGYPRWNFNWNVDAKKGPVEVSYEMRYIGDMVPGDPSDIFSIQGRPPQNADAYPIRFYPSVFYHDVRLGVDYLQNNQFYVGVDNIANKQPPYGLTGVGGGSSIYDARGRYIYAGFQVKF